MCFDPDEVATQRVLAEVAEERARQRDQYGSNADLEDGTGPETRWLAPFTGASAEQIEARLRVSYEDYEAEAGKPTWVHLVLEEVAEAFQESDPAALRRELLQVAALAVSWVEKIDARGTVAMSEAVDEHLDEQATLW